MLWSWLGNDMISVGSLKEKTNFEKEKNFSSDIIFIRSIKFKIFSTEMMKQIGLVTIRRRSDQLL